MNRLFILTLCFCMTKSALTQTSATHHPVQDLLPINGDTLIAAKWYGGLVITFDAGKTWQVLSPDILFKTMTIDDKGVLWGMDSWKGIHESDYSRLYSSPDKGKTWKETTFDTKKFFPYEIVSKPHEPLRINAWDQKDYVFGGKNPLTDWKYVSSNLEGRGEIRDGNFKIFSQGSKGALFKFTSIWDTVYTFKKLYAFDLHVKHDTAFIVGGNGKSYFAYFVNNQLKELPMEGMEAYGIREDNKGRIWIFDTEGIYLFANDKLQKFY